MLKHGVEWEIVDDGNNKGSYPKWKRSLIAKCVYKNMDIEVYRGQEMYYDRYTETYKRRTTAYVYVMTVTRNGELVKNDKGQFYFTIDKEYYSKTKYMKGVIERLDRDMYFFSGDQKFDHDNKIKLETDELKIREVLKNIPQYMKFFNATLCAENVSAIVEKCAELYDDMNFAISEYNKYMEMRKEYQKEYDDYQRLPSEYRKSSVVVSTREVKHHRPMRTHESDWGDYTSGGEAYYVTENTYGENHRYISPPSDKKVVDMGKKCDRLLSELREKTSRIV